MLISVVLLHFHGSSLCLSRRQRAELEDLKRQLEENSSLAARVLREELEKNRQEQERRHQVRSVDGAVEHELQADVRSAAH